MVKIVEESLEDRTIARNMKTLVEVTKELLGKDSVDERTANFVGIINGFMVNEELLISPPINENYQISVPEEKYFDTAMKLAEAYEKAIGKEITVRKNY